MWLRLYILQLWLSLVICNFPISKCDFISHNVTFYLTVETLFLNIVFLINIYFLKLQLTIFFFKLYPTNYLSYLILYLYYWGINRLKAKEFITCLHLVQLTISKLTTSCSLIFCTLGIRMTGFKTNTHAASNGTALALKVDKANLSHDSLSIPSCTVLCCDKWWHGWVHVNRAATGV